MINSVAVGMKPNRQKVIIMFGDTHRGKWDSTKQEWLGSGEGHAFVIDVSLAIDLHAQLGNALKVEEF